MQLRDLIMREKTLDHRGEFYVYGSIRTVFRWR